MPCHARRAEHHRDGIIRVIDTKGRAWRDQNENASIRYLLAPTARFQGEAAPSVATFIGMPRERSAIAAAGTLDQKAARAVELEVFYDRHDPWRNTTMLYGLAIVLFGVSRLMFKTPLTVAAVDPASRKVTFAAPDEPQTTFTAGPANATHNSSMGFSGMRSNRATPPMG